MAGALVATLPLGLGIALNPLAIVAGILVLRNPDSRRNGVAFASGWIAGLTVLMVLSTRISQLLLDPRRGAPSGLPSILWIGLGVLFLVGAVYAVRHRSLPAEPATPQRWVRVIDRGGTGRLIGLGLFLSMVSLRNLALLAAAAGMIGQAQLAVQQTMVTVALFVAISSIGIVIPLLVAVFGGAGADATLAGWGDWLIRHMGTITAGVMAILGILLLSRGIGGVF